jgi:diaminohydroxyphosphoribosylaminopyrimidine deaminase/5-amino-6-(5-phosphoribosylamino)uracil reductase
VFNAVKQEQYDNLQYYLLHKEADLLHQLLEALYALKLQSVLVEGGARFLQMFIDHGTWDEIRVLRNAELNIMEGLRAPALPSYARKENLTLAADLLTIYYPS